MALLFLLSVFSKTVNSPKTKLVKSLKYFPFLVLCPQLVLLPEVREYYNTSLSFPQTHLQCQ